MSIFSEMVEQIVKVFMDDFFVYGSNFESCLENLEKVLTCKETNLVLNWENCHFMVKQSIVLGNIISYREMEVDKSKIETIQKLPTPRNLKDIISFLGHVRFYRRFSTLFSTITRPLCHLLSQDVPLEWTPTC